MEDKHWKPVPIPEYADYYLVSNYGDVYSIRSGRCLTPKSSLGYLRVVLSIGGVTKNCAVHRLVALAFIPNPDNKPTVNHINEIKKDNYVGNLEWATHLEQNIHGTRIARAVAHTDWKARTEKIDYKQIAAKHNYHEINKEQMKPMLQYSNDSKLIARFDGVSQAARTLGIRPSHICCCLKGRRKTCAGYKWKYA